MDVDILFNILNIIFLCLLLCVISIGMFKSYTTSINDNKYDLDYHNMLEKVMVSRMESYVLETFYNDYIGETSFKYIDSYISKYYLADDSVRISIITASTTFILKDTTIINTYKLSKSFKFFSRKKRKEFELFVIDWVTRYLNRFIRDFIQTRDAYIYMQSQSIDPSGDEAKQLQSIKIESEIAISEIYEKNIQETIDNRCGISNTFFNNILNIDNKEIN